LKGLAAVNEDFRDLNEQVSKDVAQLEKLIKNYDSKPEDFERLFSSVLAKRQQQTEKIWDDRKAMLRHIQPDEWQAILSGARAAKEKNAPKK
jgi:ABC-type transporter Mla subunit MlaD